MSAVLIDRRIDLQVLSDRALKAAARFWFVVTVIGMLLFAVSVATFYGRATVRGDWQAFGHKFTHGFVAGDTIGGVWFFRIGLMLWLVVNHGPAGFDPTTFTGPALTFIAFAQTLVPITLLEVYLRARDGGGPAGRFATAIGLVGLTFVTGFGLFAATMGLFLPAILDGPMR